MSLQYLPHKLPGTLGTYMSYNSTADNKWSWYSLHVVELLGVSWASSHFINILKYFKWSQPQVTTKQINSVPPTWTKPRMWKTQQGRTRRLDQGGVPIITVQKEFPFLPEEVRGAYDNSRGKRGVTSKNPAAAMSARHSRGISSWRSHLKATFSGNSSKNHPNFHPPQVLWSSTWDATEQGGGLPPVPTADTDC